MDLELSDLRERRAHICDQGQWVFHGREMAAPRGLVVMTQVREALFRPSP